jgi:hypothetical protein
LVSVGRAVKVWIFVSLCSLLVWILRWMPGNLERFYNIVFISWDYYPRTIVSGSMYFLATVGMIARLVGVILGLVSVYMVWKGNKGSFLIRKWVATALALEGVYYASFIPAVIFLLALESRSGPFSYTFGISYFLQVLFTVPFLAVLAFKVHKYERGPNGFQSWKWVGIAFSGYVAALWANSVMRWFDMILAGGLAFLLNGSDGLGFLNAAVFMSFGVIFSVVGAFSLAKQKIGSAKRWLGLSLAMVGLHYVIYLFYSYLIDGLVWVWLIDVWAIPLLGLGISLLKMKQQEEYEKY